MAKNSIRQHEDIISACLVRSEQWAETAVVAHLSRALARFQKHSLATGSNKRAAVTLSVFKGD